MKKILVTLVITTMIFGFTGCGTFAGYGPGSHSSQVTLEDGNFTVVQSGVEASATVTVLFPALGALGIPGGPAGLPLGDAALYQRAMDQLRGQIKDNSNVGLVNLTVDERLKHFAIIGWKTVTITADVVKFK